MNDHDDMNTDQMAKRIETLRSQNQAHMERLGRVGAQFNWVPAMVAHHFKFLAEAGIIPEATFIRMQLAWEEHLRTGLNEAEEQIALQRANAEAARRAQQGGLVLPPGSPLARG
jgi:hypothetical protein